jgi:NhaC family Na+:H+ antiporter
VIGDSAVTTSVFFPWNTCGAYFIAVLGIAPWAYIPYCFFNLLSVVISILYGYFNWFIQPLEKERELLEEEMEE